MNCDICNIKNRIFLYERFCLDVTDDDLLTGAAGR